MDGVTTYSPDQLHEYQKRAVNLQCAGPESMVWADPGLGKTAITLTSIVHLLSHGYLNAVLVVAPIKVCRLVWRQESKKWSHTQGLTFEMVMGTPDQRIRALMRPAHIYITNYENLAWLAKTIHHYWLTKNRPFHINGLVWDEIDKCSNSTTRRVTSFMKILNHESQPFRWVTGQTGTPASEGYKMLHGQYLVVDKEKHLGEHKTKFMQFYYHKEGTHKLVPYANAENDIKARISDITLELSEADYNPLPDLIVNDIELELPSDLRERYDRMEEEMWLQLDSAGVELFNQASLMNKALQFAAGHVYTVPNNPAWEHIHDLKLDALEDLIDECNGQPILLGYQFRSDAERIEQRFKGIDPINLTECKSQRALDNAMSRWKRGDCRLMIAHPASAGHGIDGLQDAGHTLCWFGLAWSLRYYIQFNGRLRRQGQGTPVISHRIVMRDTTDDAQRIALAMKADSEKSLRAAVKQYRQQRGM